jgi:hypothetical protein
MATTEEEDLPPATVTVADRLGHIWEEVLEVPARASDVVYGGRTRSLWPLSLIGVALAALVVGGAVATVLGAIALMLLAVWATAMEVKK